jgi:uncharacterized phiE125 gp8 family phage protein
MRWLDPEVTAAPTFQPVDLDSAKAAQVIETSDWDDLLEGYLVAAQGIVESRTGLTLATQTLKLRAWGFDCPTFVLPAAPIQSVESIEYLDQAGVLQTLSTAVYETALYGLTPTVSLKYGQMWPVHRCGLGSVVITCIAGYDAAAAPPAVAQAIRLAFGDFNTFREQAALGVVSEIASVAIDNLLINHRRSAA